ncbi:Arc family DNA-binding protein, partial [Acinetobacter towneri]|uniref:Arc family DNA-binding protein n=1 Tax=Acinetobacter towneri TaxID=202956 RepID=UPI0025771034
PINKNPTPGTGEIPLSDLENTKPKFTRIVLRLPEDILQELKRLSEEEKRSTNSQILYMLEKSLINSR